MRHRFELLIGLFGWVAVSSFAPSSGRADVLINEIHYHPEQKTVFEEFIELTNTGEEAVDLSGWFFADGIHFEFPEGTTIEPGGFLVVAESPDVLAESLGFQDALGPYEGLLSNDGESVILRRADGSIVDRVNYQADFPWPTAADGNGGSMELIHPGLDNDLGGSWRTSGTQLGPQPTEREYFLNREAEGWRYRKGTSEASDPIDAWRDPDFVMDDTWLTGQTSIGFNDDDDNTLIDDMEDNYLSLFLRKEFTVDEVPAALKLGFFIDDGAVVFINGVEVARINVVEGDLTIETRARRSTEARWDDMFLPGPGAYLRKGSNVVAVHVFNSRVTSNDVSSDIEIFAPGPEDFEGFMALPPSPGAPNTVLSSNAPPQIRQVDHSPTSPTSQDNVIVTARVTDPQGVAQVVLRYQLVEPGRYIPAFLPLPSPQLLSRPLEPRPRNPEFEDPKNWTEIVMVDDGSGVDQVASDGVYSARIDAQPHRHIVRYRVAATDAKGWAQTVPYEDDKGLNFAYFSHDGVPAYVADRVSVHPEGAGHVYSEEVMNGLPVYHLVTREADFRQCTGYSGGDQIPKSNENARDKFNWEGAFYYDGVLYDHVRYRLRQANDRYGGSGKRSMRIRFNKGNYLRVRDNYGRRYPTRWRTLNTGKMFDNKRVGNFGLTEKMNHDLWNMVGVPAPSVHTFHFRVLQREQEVPEDPNGQFLGDFYGMFVVFEDYDPRFLDAHNLVDGNLYKLKDGQFNGHELRRNQGRFATTTDADFQNIRRNLRPTQTNEWLDAHVNYDRWNRYHAVVEGIRHYDFVPADSHSKNRAWYFEPHEDASEHGRVWTLPWDSDASWGPNWNSGIDYSKNAIFGGRGKEPFKMNYRNNMREFRDLVWTDEAIPQMIDDLAEFVTEFSMADRDRYRTAPTIAGRQDFGPIERKIVDMKNFAFVGWTGSTGPSVPAGGRARHLDNLAAAQGEGSLIPETPIIEPTGPDSFPADRLRFRAGAFTDPQGDAFGAMRWRLGEVTPAGTPFDRENPRKYEVPALWEEELSSFEEDIVVPSTVVEVGHTYRVRLRFRDDNGRWSHWSEPVEFTVSEPESRPVAETSIRISEMMYNPAGDESFEFIEITNVGPDTVDLADVAFTDGIEFSFRDGDVASIAPGEFVVVVGNLPVFESRYDTTGMPIAGQYSGQLSNGGERVELSFGAGFPILAFEYDDAWHPLTDGTGFSLVVGDITAARDSWGEAASWRASAARHGSPGEADSEPEGGFQLPGDLSQDGRANITDAVQILGALFRGAELPCGDGSVEANTAVADLNGDQDVSIADAVHLLNYLFREGAAPTLGVDCVRLATCPDACAR